MLNSFETPKETLDPPVQVQPLPDGWHTPWMKPLLEHHCDLLKTLVLGLRQRHGTKQAQAVCPNENPESEAPIGKHQRR